MINKDELVCIGYIKRPHGFKGEIQFQLNKEIALNKGDFVFIAFDGQYIPYPIERINANSQEPIVKLRFIPDFDHAKSIGGRSVYVLGLLEEEEDDESVVGYTLIDKKKGNLGKVLHMAYFPQQIMMIIQFEGKECYVPMNEQFIIKIIDKNKEIYCNLPEGLLDL